jgi:post-segregation antitoxin (ccd killing protein)
MSTTATIRIDAELLRRARRRKVNVSQAARQGIEDAIRAHDFRENTDWLAAHEVRPVEPSGTTLRRIRDHE